MVVAEEAHESTDNARAFALIADMARGFSESSCVETTLLQALTSIASLVGAEAGSLWVVDDSGTALTCQASVGPSSITGARLPVSEGIVGKSVRENICQTVLDAAQDPNFAPGVDQASGMVTRSIVCAPMSFSDEVVGAVELINKEGGDGCFAKSDAQLLRILAASAGLAICNQRLAARQIETERMRREVELAGEIQASMLPLIFPPFPDRDELSIFAKLRPAREVAGDFYDFILVDEHRLCFWVGDVSGKGMPSALFMSAATMLIRLIARNESSPASIMTQLNDEVSRNNPSCMFATIFLGSLDLRSGTLVYTNAGHNPPYLKCADGSIEGLAQRHGPVVGAVSGLAYRESTVQLSTGDLVLLYTDGVTEARDPDGDLFSEQRLTDLLSAHSFASVEARPVMNSARTDSARDSARMPEA